MQLPTSLTRLSLPFSRLSVLPCGLCLEEGTGEDDTDDRGMEDHAGAEEAVAGGSQVRRTSVVLGGLETLVLVIFSIPALLLLLLRAAFDLCPSLVSLGATHTQTQ